MCPPRERRFSLHVMWSSQLARSHHVVWSSDPIRARSSTPSLETRAKNSGSSSGRSPKTKPHGRCAHALKDGFRRRPKRYNDIAFCCNRRSCAQRTAWLQEVNRIAFLLTAGAQAADASSASMVIYRWSQPQYRDGMAQLQTWWCRE